MIKATIYLALAGTVALLVAVLLTVADVLMRSLSSETVQGLTDIVTLCTVIGAMLAIPYGFAVDQHVSIDVFTSRMSAGVRRALRIVAALLGIVFLAGVLWFSTSQAWLEWGYGDRSQSIGIPLIWYWLPLLAGMALSVVVNVRLLFREPGKPDTKTQAE